MPHRRSASPTRTLSLCCCQTKAWKAGHKCVAAARADTRTAAKPTAEQMRVLKMLEQLAGAADWRGVLLPYYMPGFFLFCSKKCSSLAVEGPFGAVRTRGVPSGKGNFNFTIIVTGITQSLGCDRQRLCHV